MQKSKSEGSYFSKWDRFAVPNLMNAYWRPTVSTTLSQLREGKKGSIVDEYYDIKVSAVSAFELYREVDYCGRMRYCQMNCRPGEKAQ